MNVIPFRPSQGGPRNWRQSEIDKIVSAAKRLLTTDNGSGWAVGLTEAGDPQLYLFGPAPKFDCVLMVTRLGNRYILEDGRGQVLFEHRDLEAIAARIGIAVRFRSKARLIGQLLLAGYAVRTTIEERIEPVLAEPLELVTHLAPQFAALA